MRVHGVDLGLMSHSQEMVCILEKCHPVAVCNVQVCSGSELT
jgi:hypothetical protein